MDKETKDYLTKELLQKAAPQLSSSFEDGLMLQIEALPNHAIEKQTSLRYSLLWLSVGSLVAFLVFFVGYFQSIPFATFYSALALFLNVPVNQDLVYFSFIPFFGLAGFYFFYFFDLFLSDYFDIKNNQAARSLQSNNKDILLLRWCFHQ